MSAILAHATVVEFSGLLVAFAAGAAVGASAVWFAIAGRQPRRGER